MHDSHLLQNVQILWSCHLYSTKLRTSKVKKTKKKKSLLVSAKAKAESNERLSFQEANPNILQTSVHIFK